ncbi:hypothetical protein P3G55_17835 [Leptospira sp. 96542]|nr:hypothetical protein [Leptospira sp. 96542]
MNNIIIGSLTFHFQNNSIFSKYDEWSFYRNQFSKISVGVKAVDIILIESNVTWLIEVKDYRHHARTKVIDLGEEIALKVRDTLAGLAAARVNANDNTEKSFSNRALKTSKINIVLHLEQPNHTTRLMPKLIDTTKVLMKLKQLLKSIDPHPEIVNCNSLTNYMNWQVS